MHASFRLNVSKLRICRSVEYVYIYIYITPGPPDRCGKHKLILYVCYGSHTLYSFGRILSGPFCYLANLPRRANGQPCRARWERNGLYIATCDNVIADRIQREGYFTLQLRAAPDNRRCRHRRVTTREQPPRKPSLSAIFLSAIFCLSASIVFFPAFFLAGKM